MEEKILANFEIGTNQYISGVYEPGHENKKFSLWSKDYINIKDHSCIHGVTSSNQCISLVDCLGRTGWHIKDNDRTYRSEVYSHILIIGESYIQPDESNIKSISIEIANPYKFLKDAKSFGYINFPTPSLISELNKQKYASYFEAEKNPFIAYFNGDFEIFSHETDLGIVSAENQVSTGVFGGTDGVNINNTIIIKLRFNSCVKLDDSFSHLSELTRFLRLIGADGLFFKNITIQKTDSESDFSVLHDSYEWGEESINSTHDTPLLDVQYEYFGTILVNWFNKVDRKVVRSNFYSTYFKDVYSSDRLISAANIFDIFPDDNKNKKMGLHPDLKSALIKLKRQIKAELEGYEDEKNKLLQSIGFLSRKSLRDRIEDRLNFIDHSLFDLPIDDIQELIGHCVKARNYFVHGSKVNGLSADQLYEYQALFIQCLEYIYAVSELIECGWKPDQHSMYFSQHRLGGMKSEIQQGFKNLQQTLKAIIK